MIHVLAAQHPGILHGGSWNSSDTIALVIIVVIIAGLAKFFSR